MNKYDRLIPSAQREGKKFFATVSALGDAFSAQQAASAALVPAFDLDSAAGKQLDILGLWIGRGRRITTPLTDVYFAFDTEGVGWEQGSWKREFDPDDGVTDLDDESYIAMLRAKTLANQWNGTYEKLVDIYKSMALGKSINLFFIDNQDMSIDVYLTGGIIPEAIKALLKQGYLNVKSLGVRINNKISSEENSGIYGCDVDNGLVSGFDSGSWAITL